MTPLALAVRQDGDGAITRGDWERIVEYINIGTSEGARPKEEA